MDDQQYANALAGLAPETRAALEQAAAEAGISTKALMEQAIAKLAADLVTEVAAAKIATGEMEVVDKDTVRRARPE
jgi:hypothetical protein